VISEIQSAGYTTSQLEHILQSQAAGLVGDELASEALGFRKGEVEKAKKDRTDKAVAVLQAQTAVSGGPGGATNPASRGVPELDPNPQSGKEEQAAAKQVNAVTKDAKVSE